MEEKENKKPSVSEVVSDVVDLLDDSVILIPDDETEQAELETSFSLNHQPLPTDPGEDALVQCINDLAIDTFEDDETKAPEVDSGRESPLPLRERLKLKYKAQGQLFPMH